MSVSIRSSQSGILPFSVAISTLIPVSLNALYGIVVSNSEFQ